MQTTPSNPFISICVPAYKRTHYLKRLLNSIREQNFTDFEIVISDDTPGNEVEILYKEHQSILPIRYFKNATALGTPENWNEAIRKASGEWIKIMHDDDWFTSPESLAVFATAAKQQTDHFIFSAYHFINEKTDTKKTTHLNVADLTRLKKDAFYLYRTNYIGNPSCTLFKKVPEVNFDKRFKWVVDFEFYIRYLTTTKKHITYVNEPLINVGVNDTQVTTYTFRVPKVEIPENHLMLATQGFGHLNNIFIYDYFWRLYRNLSITSIAQVAENGYTDQLPTVLTQMIRFQQKIPKKLLHFGPISKTLMFLHYLKNWKTIRYKP